MARCPVRMKDPDACVDFSTQGNLVTDAYRENYDRIFRKKIRREPCDDYCETYPDCRCGREE